MLRLTGSLDLGGPPWLTDLELVVEAAPARIVATEADGLRPSFDESRCWRRDDVGGAFVVSVNTVAAALALDSATSV